MRMATQDISRDRFSWTPYPDPILPITDEGLLKFFEIEDEEAKYIESIVSPMESTDV
jgi:hypothetical protein